VRALLGVLTPIVLAPVLATGAAAQSLPIEGTVAAAATGEPLAGAVVYLLNSELQGVRAVLSDGGGAFQLTAAGPGRYSLEVERIGFEMSLFPPFEVPEGGIRNLSLRVQVRPIEVEGISVTAETVCDIAGGGGDLVGVWTEARKALTATVLRHGAEGHGPPMPIGYTLDPDHPVVFVKAWGVLAERDVVAVAAALRSDPRVSPGWATLADTRDVEDIRVGGSLIRGYSSALAPTARARVARAPRGDRASRSGR
jgi:hypothetical protein